MTVIDIPSDQVPKIFDIAMDNVRKAAKKAARAAAYRMKAYLIKKVDDLKITDRGIYKNSFRVVGESVLNDAPHAPIIEDGARPHPVSEAGVQAIAAWARRKLGIKDEAQALGIARAIAWKIRHHGQEAKNVMRNEIPMAIVFFGQEFQRIMGGGK